MSYLENKTYTLEVKDITKIKQFKKVTVFYTKDKYFVCKSTQRLPIKNDIWITLYLAKEGDSNEE